MLRSLWICRNDSWTEKIGKKEREERPSWCLTISRRGLLGTQSPEASRPEKRHATSTRNVSTMMRTAPSVLFRTDYCRRVITIHSLPSNLVSPIGGIQGLGPPRHPT